MKIVFLDIDGVLNTFESLRLCKESGGRPHTHSGWSSACLTALERLLDTTDARVVISSVWRLVSKEHLIMGYHFNHWLGDRVVGHTKDLYSPGEDRTLRGQEIQEWLDEHDVESYVILDDDSDMLDSQAPFFVQTSMQTGLTEEHVDRAIAILGS